MMGGYKIVASCLYKTKYNPFPFMPFLNFEEEKLCRNRKSQRSQPQWLTPGWIIGNTLAFTEQFI
jgi:hypothetical protein